MNYNIRNVRIFATPAADSSGINIYLDFSGQREYLIFYRFNYKLYMLLKNGRVCPKFCVNTAGSAK